MAKPVNGNGKKTPQQMADMAEQLTGQGALRQAAQLMSTRGTRSRMDAAEEEALSTNGKPKR